MSTTAADNFSTLPTEVGRAQIEYPFKKNGDRTTRIVKRTYKQLAGNFTPTALGSPDVTFSDHYLIEETDPQPTQTGLESFTRTYATIPTTQTVPSSVILSKPSLSGTFPQDYGSFRIFQPDATLLRYDVYATQTVLSDSGAPTFNPSGGTYTLSFAGATTPAMAHNSSNTTVQTELNALTPVSNRGSLTVSGSYNAAGGFSISFNGYSQISISTGSLTGGTISKVESLLSNGYAQFVSAYIAPSSTSYPRIDYSGLVTSGSIFNGTSGDSTQGFYAFAANSGGAGYGVISGGTFTISIVPYGSTTATSTTGPIAYNATIEMVQAALDAMSPGLYLARQSSLNTPAPGSVLSLIPYCVGVDILYVPAAPTGGTYTLTAFTQTTGAIAYNATAATVQSALNALSNVANRGNCTVAGDIANGFTFTFTNPVITADATSLVPSASTITPATTDSGIGRLQQIVMTSSSAFRTLYVASHGVSAGDVLYLRTAATSYPLVTAFTIPDANTIRLSVTASSAYSAALTIATIGRRTMNGYEPGAQTVRCRRITDFYLPGVSAGITTAEDITVPFAQSDGPSLLLAIFAGTGTFNVSVGELTQWRDGPILSLTKTTINAADV